MQRLMTTSNTGIPLCYIRLLVIFYKLVLSHLTIKTEQSRTVGNSNIGNHNFLKNSRIYVDLT